ncbi:MAG: D-aminoacyl-tRNA deacylase [Verrucomicrobiota bacterium]
MRAVVQRVSRASVVVGGVEAGAIERGLVVFLGVGREDTEADLDWLLEKLFKARIFEDSEGRMNLDLQAVDGGVLLISQFTLFGSMKKGTRPSFNRAGEPAAAEALYETAAERLRERLGAERVGTGRFGQHMDIAVQNDGPVTLIFDSQARDF